MTDANETCDTIMQELNIEVISDTEETVEEQESFSFSFHEEADVDDIPPSLLSYFETSKSRAAVCEKLILEELEDFTASHPTEDMMNLPTEPDEDMWKLNEQADWDAENEESDTFTDTRLLPAPTETEALFTHNVSVCPSNEDEAGSDEYVENEKRLAFETRTLEISLNDEERKKSREYEAEREKRHCEEIKKEQQKRQIEREFQEDLKKIMEAEKLRQKELELMEKRAQEKLEQELLLQQELISNLKRRVEEERRMREEEQKRMKDEEDKRKREEEKIKVEAERKRMEEETRRKIEEERKIEEMKLKKEEERKNKEHEKREMEREEKRKREEERNKIDLEKKKLEEELRMMKEEEERKNKEEVERIKKEEEGKREEERKIEETRKKMEKEKRKMEEEMSMKKEEECRKKEEEERKKREEKNMRIEEEGRLTEEIEERKKEEEMRKKKGEEEADDRNKMYEEMRKSYKREHGNVDEEIKLEERKKTEEKDMKKRVEARKREKETKKIEEKKEVNEVVRKGKGQNSKVKEELRPIEEDEKRKREDEWKTKEEEQRRRQKEEMRRQKEEMRRQRDEEMRLKEDKDVYKGYDNRKMEHESKTKDKERKQEEEEKKQGKEEMRKRKEERKNVGAEKEQNGEEVRENKNEVRKKTGEEMRIKEKEESKTRRVQDREEEVRVVKANELQEKRENNSMMGQNKKKNIDKTENSWVSQLEDGPTWTSSSLGPLHSESTICRTSTETTQQQRDLDKNISRTSIDKTVNCENQATRPSTMSVFLPVCLPEHTEQKRLSWMKDCVSWSKLSLQNRRKQKGSVQSRRGWRRVLEANSLPPLCPDSLLQSTGWKSLKEVTTVTLEHLPGCSLSTLTQCTQLRSLTLRRCGLKSLEGINQLPRLCYIDVQENYISFVDCENMTSLRVLRLAHNKLTSIHGLTGAENLDVLDLSHNSITRIAGLESMRRLQRLSVDHNQLISTKGLRDVYTLLDLNCSHNHLASVEGLENSALLNTLDLRANSLTEPPSLKNQVLLRELRLDDNSISSLQDLTACWLPLMQHLSVAQNRITQLPSMSDSVSLTNLDLRFNCLSELQNVCESLEGCQFLREVHLTGNPLQQESGWRSTLLKAVPGLRAIDDQETDCFLSPPAVQEISLALGGFLTFCQAQLQQTHDLQQQHSRELSNASSSLDAVKTSCRHFTEALQQAEDQRFAHEYGDTTVADKHRAAGQTTPEETLDMDNTNAEKCTERPEMESTGKVIPNGDSIRCSSWTCEEKSAAESRHDTFDTVATGPKTGPTVNKSSLATKGKTVSSNVEMAPVSNHQNLDLQNTAAVVIQQLWRKYRQKCGNISSPSTAEKGGGRGGDGGKPESRPSCINGCQDYAATVIQAFWRGFTLRRRLASALAAVTCFDSGEDNTFEEVDVDEFVFDEAALEKHWTFSLSEDSPPGHYPVSEQLLSVKPPRPFPEPSQYILPPPLVWRSKQAWVAGEQVGSAKQRVSPVSSNRSKSPASTSVVSGLSERSEKILEEWGFTHSHTALLMLKRAQNMKSKRQQQKKRKDPVRLALFRNCSYQLGPVEARYRQAQNNRNYMKVREAELGLQQAEKTERGKQEQAQQWLHTQAAHPDRDSESVHFLPEISSDILNGGRVQLVADPGYTEHLHHASGLWASSSLAAQPRKESNYPRRNSLGHARKEVPSPKRVTSAPSKKERISFRDNPVQLSGGWGGGKKRDKVYK